MIKNIPSKPSFDTAVAGPIKSVALFIDVQSFAGMSREDAIAYKDAVGTKLTELRGANIPVIWVAIAPGSSKLCLPSSQHDSDKKLRPFAEIEDIGFTGHQTTFENHDIYADFMANFGPRQNEVVYRKPSMSALATTHDIPDRGRILEEAGIKLKEHRQSDDWTGTKYITADEQEGELAKLFSTEDPTLYDYLKAHGTTETHIMGAVAKYCVAETAISSAVKGFKTNIMSDLVLSWKYPVTRDSRENAQLVWADFDHDALIQESILNARHDKQRQFSAEDFRAIATIKISGATPQLLEEHAGEDMVGDIGRPAPI